MTLPQPMPSALMTEVAAFAFWGSVSLIVYAYAGYPLLLRLLCAFKRFDEPAPSTRLSVTVIISAHNEAASLERKLNNTLSLDYPKAKLQVIVASDGSTDDTEDIVRRFAGRGVELVRIARQAGKTNAQNLAVLEATGDILVFSDATTLYQVDAFQYLAGNFTDSRVGACSGHYVYVEDETTAASGNGSQTYASYDNSVRNLQSRLGSITGCCGCIYAVRRSLYTALEPHIISDLVQPIHVVAQGFRVTFEARAIAWETTASTERGEFAMRVRVIARALAGLYSVRGILSMRRHPWFLFQIFSHKLLRWSVPCFLMITLAASALLASRPFYAIALSLQLLLYASAWVASLLPTERRIRGLKLALYFCIVNAAAMAGLLQFVRGKRYITWRPQRRDAHAG